MAELKTIDIHIGSEHREVGGTTENFRVNLGKTVQAQKISLLSVELANSFYNVTSADNSIEFELEYGGGLLTRFVGISTITPGSYSVTQYVTALQAALNAAVLDGGYTVAPYNSAVNPFVVTYDSKANKLLLSTALTTQNFIVKSAGTTLQRPAGFSQVESADSALSQLMYSSSQVDLRGPVNAYIHCNLCPAAIGCGGKMAQILAKVPLTSAFPDPVYFTSPNFADRYFAPKNGVDVLEFSLRDQDGALLSNGGVEWSLTLTAVL